MLDHNILHCCPALPLLWAKTCSLIKIPNPTSSALPVPRKCRPRLLGRHHVRFTRLAAGGSVSAVVGARPPRAAAAATRSAVEGRLSIILILIEQRHDGAGGSPTKLWSTCSPIRLNPPLQPPRGRLMSPVCSWPLTLWCSSTVSWRRYRTRPVRTPRACAQTRCCRSI